MKAVRKRHRSRLAGLLLLVLSWSLSAQSGAAEKFVIGSKNFNESYILSELVAQILLAQGYEVERKFGLGGTLICYEALANGEIDIYIEYTGTISQVILKSAEHLSLEQLREGLKQRELAMLPSLGFNNTYVLALDKKLAEQRNIRTISDLGLHKDIKAAFSHEFLQRPDGWNALADFYRLAISPVGIEHGLAYQALAQGQIEMTDAYSTDGEILRYDLHLLKDDRAFFPDYLAVPLVRSENQAILAEALASLAGAIDEAGMQAMNARVTLDRLSFEQVAKERLGLATFPAMGSRLSEFEMLTDETWPLFVRHLELSGLALLLACLLGIPLAIYIHNKQKLSALAVYIAGLLQTIPSIAMLALFIPFLGIGFVPAVSALFLYSLLPILRNTIVGLTTVDANLIRLAKGMGMSSYQRLRHVVVPLALPSILAGVRTAAVISIGTATLAAFIGAGGLGEPIVTGLALNDPVLILQGALPSALLAIITELVFELIEILLIPKHLRRTQN